MASTPGSRDPRRVAYDPRLKRQASRSPSAEHKPANKTARPQAAHSTAISTSASHDDGSRGRQSSISSNDPRFTNMNGVSPAHSRRNSTQTNGNTNGSAAGYNSYVAGGGSGRSTPQSSTAPVANMSSANPTNGQSQTYSSIFTAFMNMSDQGARVARAEIALDAANAALQKATREYDASKAQFVQFPAIREAKTTARDKAQRAYDDATKGLQQAKSAQQKLVGTAASALLGGEERVTRAEFNQLRGETERQLAASKPQLDVQSFATRLASLESLVTSHSTSSLEAELGAAQQDLTSLSQKVIAMEERILSAHSKLVADIQGVQQQFSPLKDRIQALEVRPIAAADDVMQERLDRLQDGQDKQADMLEEEMNKGLEELRNWTGDRVKEMQQMLTIEIDSIKSWTGNQVKDVQQTMTTEIDSVKSWTEEKARTVQQAPLASMPDVDENGLPKFRPILFPPNDEPELPWKSRVENRLMGLDHFVKDHEKRLNNTTTDSIIHDMTRIFHHHYHTEFPALKSWQTTVSDMNGSYNSLAGRVHNLETQAVGRQEVVQLRTDLNILSTKVDEHFAKAPQGEQSLQNLEAQNRLMQLRTDLDSLSTKVDEHGAKAQQGQQALQNLGNQYHALEQDLTQLQGSHQAALQRISAIETSPRR